MTLFPTEMSPVRSHPLEDAGTAAPRARVASLSLDLDNKWTYMKIHGDAGWESYPSYLHLVVPRILAVLDALKLTTTVFVVGRDATREENVDALSAIAHAGHEIGNHSFNHEPWLHLYSSEQINEELASAEAAIEAALGIRPLGFRGPGFSVTPVVLEVLKRRGYHYDASTLPTFVGPLARAYCFMTARMPPEERRKRQHLFGSLRDGLRPLNPYLWDLQRGKLVEIPVSTFPIVRLPFHLSYILYLASFSTRIAIAYFSAALQACRLSEVQPSLLLHPLDFLGGDDVPELRYFPSMGLSGVQKSRLTRALLSMFAAKFDVMTMGRHAAIVARIPKRIVAP
jgi:peptidoglycan-N-acetylglucosamine deacetylase